MATVHSWFPAWLNNHMVRHGHMNWSMEPAEFNILLDTWEAVFVKYGVTEEFAEAASVTLAAEDIPPGKHFPRLVELIRADLKETYGNKGTPSRTRETAAKESANCFDCSGSGHAVRYRHTTIDDGSDPRKRRGFRIVLHCTCPQGQWMAQQNAGINTIPNLLDFPILQLQPTATLGHFDNPYRYPPTSTPTQETQS